MTHNTKVRGAVDCYGVRSQEAYLCKVFGFFVWRASAMAATSRQVMRPLGCTSSDRLTTALWNCLRGKVAQSASSLVRQGAGILHSHFCVLSVSHSNNSHYTSGASNTRCASAERPFFRSLPCTPASLSWLCFCVGINKSPMTHASACTQVQNKLPMTHARACNSLPVYLRHIF